MLTSVALNGGVHHCYSSAGRRFWMMVFEPRAHSSSHIYYLLSFISYLLSYLLLVVFAFPVDLGNMKVSTMNALRSVQSFSFVGY